MDLYYRQEIKVGVLVLVALAITIGGMLWLTGRPLPGRGRASVAVRFAHVGGLTEGDPVMISGVLVGRVARVRLDQVGDVVVVLDIEERVRPRLDASAAIRPLDFLGAKFVAYDPGSAQEHLPADAVLDGLEETDLASSAGSVAEGIAQFIAQSQDMLGQTRATLSAAERALSVIARLGGGPLVVQAESTLTVVYRAAARVDSTLANPAIRSSVNQLDELTANVNEMAAGLAVATSALGRILAKVDTTDGTLGKLVNDSTAHQDLREVLTQLKLLLEDIRLRPGRYAPGAIKIF